MDAVAEWPTSTRLDSREKLALELCDALTDTPVRVSDDLRLRLDQAFSPRQQVALVNAITWENSRARFNRAFDVGPEGYDTLETTSTAVPDS